MSAYWIDPDGKIFEVDSKHISSIIAEPEAFGFTKAYIQSVYRKHREPLGSEGNAREEILVKLMERGWIRIRFISRQYSVTVQLSDNFHTTESYAELVTPWAKLMMKKRTLPETVMVSIINLRGSNLSEHQLYEVASGALFERKKKGTFAEFLNPSKKHAKRRKTR